MTSAYFGGKRCSSRSRSRNGSFQPVTVPGLAMSNGRGSSHSVPVAKPLHQIAREVDQSIVARAHNDDSVARPGFGDEDAADLRPLGNVGRLPLSRAYLLSQP